jgi:hypothetical protein
MADHSTSGTMNICSLSNFRTQNLTFAEQLHDTGHSFDTKQCSMDTLEFVQKGKLMNSLETRYIYSETIRNNLINVRIYNRIQ